MRKISILMFIFFTILNININCYAKYISEKQLYIANINIDVTKPKINFISAISDNEGYNKYANKEHTVTIKLSVIEKNLKEDNFREKTIWLVGNEEAKEIKTSIYSSHYKDTIKYELTLNNLIGNGKLKIKIPKRYNYR